MTSPAQIEITPTAISTRISESLTSACREAFGSSLRALVLTGSAARREITFRHVEDRVRMFSDVEAIAVLQDSATLPSHSHLSQLCAATEERLKLHGIEVHVSLSCVHGDYLRNLPAHVFSYELRTCGLVLDGEVNVLDEIPTFTESDISREDGWRLLSNRLVERLPLGSETLTERYATLKLCLDTASSLLIFFGRFEAGYAARLQAFETIASGSSSCKLPFSADAFLAALRTCTTLKLNPDNLEALDDNLIRMIRGWAWDAWVLELAQLTVEKAETPETMIRTLGHNLSWASRLRGWLYVARRVGWAKSVAYWPQWFRLFAQGFTPRTAVYLATYEFDRHDLSNITRLLPVEIAPAVSKDGTVAAQIYWNYQEFVVNTRA